MKTIVVAIISLLASYVLGQGLEVDGSVKISDSPNANNQPGTIRFNGSDFEGWNGTAWISLTKSTESILDIENNKYQIGEIGTQTWMFENLRVTRYNDSTQISLVTDDITWKNTSTPAYTWYNNASSPYGALYNYYVAADTNSRNVCPTGWHVPSYGDWVTLINYLGGNLTAGRKMKETGLSKWINPNSYASNESGFTGLPGGRRTPDGIFERINVSMDTWSSSGSGGGGAWFQGLWVYSDIAYLTGNGDPRWGYSIRCLKN